ncbi:DNA-binding transcriptional regulator, ArsR family [Prauserella flava]|uniref:DNA-binding transcriptional ArsR family regulator n=1 Tax=Prauserella sediminis TaxID=577680 RepID=A0A839XHX9_9PSEU|nr:DNA-binding transcriptional ArsR family regulator [Prauserella sediminis]MCR3720577.1 DNA-binding transcriptional regulator, ArsR family [Prauserella flava]MCR3733713.1 DNA-binding transcriptional regulator, ArsR family [Prauserella salsuginis]
MLTSETREAALSRLGRALADPTRCRILVALLDGVNYPGQLATKLDLTRSNVSNHLACLRGCGLVVAAYEGRQVRYELADPHLAGALGEFVQVVLAVDTGQPCVDDTRPAAAPAPESAAPESAALGAAAPEAAAPEAIAPPCTDEVGTGRSVVGEGATAVTDGEVATDG